MFVKRIIIFTGLLAIASFAFSQPTFQDADFATGWTTTLLTKVPATASAPASVVTTGGVGLTPAFRQVQHSNYNFIVAAHSNQLATYNPANGAIASLDYSYDIRGIGVPAASAVGFRLLVLQNGTAYGAPYDQVFGSAWLTVPVKTVTSSSFVRLSSSGPELPDFTCTGAPITFGYATGNSIGANQPPATLTNGIDNWMVRVNRGGCCSTQTVCMCPSGSIVNSFDIGDNKSPRCIRKVCELGKDANANGTLLGVWGFTWDNIIWQWVDPTCATTVKSSL
jgi:hypothetical protein